MNLNQLLRPQRRTRSGLSIIHVVGCLGAVAAGVWVGASYTGIDLRAAWQIGLERAGVAAPRGDQAGQNPSADSTGPQPTPASGRTANTANNQQAADADATLEFWTALRDIIHQERSVRQEGELAAGGDSRTILFAQGKAFQQAANDLHQLKKEAVDQDAIELGNDLAQWYQRGGELSEEGALLLDEGDLAGAQGPQGKRWHASQRQHREELDLLTRKSNSLLGKLNTRYQLSFPGLQ